MLNKRYAPVMVAVVILLAVSMVGYTRTQAKTEMPVRILFHNNGGKVIFSHLVHHRNYKIPCADCHHEMTHAEDKALACGSCHPVAFDEHYVDNHIASFPDKKYCIQCHHIEYEHLIFDHDEHIEFAEDNCQACHHGEDIEPEPGQCKSCHEDKGDDDMPGLASAAHKRCQGCHEDMFEQGLTSCTSCHEAVDMSQYDGDFSSCGQCHNEHTKDLVLNRMNAFHDQCMDCHERKGKGPFGENSCFKCHIR